MRNKIPAVLDQEYDQANRILAVAKASKAPPPKLPPHQQPAPGGTLPQHAEQPQNVPAPGGTLSTVHVLKQTLRAQFVGASWRHVLSAHTTSRPGGREILRGGIQKHFSRVDVGGLIGMNIDMPSTWQPDDGVHTVVQGPLMDKWEHAREECCFEAVACLLAMSPSRFRMVPTFWAHGQNSINAILELAEHAHQEAEALPMAAPGAKVPVPWQQHAPVNDWQGRPASSNQERPDAPPMQVSKVKPQVEHIPPRPQRPCPCSGLACDVEKPPNSETASGVSRTMVPITKVEAKTNLQTMEHTITITVTPGTTTPQQNPLENVSGMLRDAMASPMYIARDGQPQQQPQQQQQHLPPGGQYHVPLVHLQQQHVLAPGSAPIHRVPQQMLPEQQQQQSAHPCARLTPSMPTQRLDMSSDGDSDESDVTAIVQCRHASLPPPAGNLPLPRLGDSQQATEGSQAAPGAWLPAFPIQVLPPLPTMPVMPMLPVEGPLPPSTRLSELPVPSLRPPATSPRASTPDVALDVPPMAILDVPPMAILTTEAAPGALYYNIATNRSVPLSAPPTEVHMGWDMIGLEAGPGTMQSWLDVDDTHRASQLEEEGSLEERPLQALTPFPWPAPPRG